MPTMLILGLNVPTRELATELLDCAIVSLVMMVLLVNVPFVLITVMIGVLAGLRRILLPKLVVLTLLLGMLSNMLDAFVMQVTEVLLVIFKNVHQELILLMVMVMKLVVIAVEEVCVIIHKVYALVSQDFMEPDVNTKQPFSKVTRIILF